MSLSPNTMTLDECRDWIALDTGKMRKAKEPGIAPDGTEETLWEEEVHGEWFECRGEEGWPDHPIPATLDAAAKAMPVMGVGYEVDWKISTIVAGSKFEATWWINGGDADGGCITADTELLARFRLAVACRMAMKEKA